MSTVEIDGVKYVKLRPTGGRFCGAGDLNCTFLHNIDIPDCQHVVKCEGFFVYPLVEFIKLRVEGRLSEDTHSFDS